MPDPDPVRSAKAKLRERMRAERTAMDVGARAALSGRIAERLFTLPAWRVANVVHLYIGAVEGEVETRAVALDALRAGKRVACPRVAPGARALEHYEIRALDELVESPRGLWEPDPERAVPLDERAFDLVVAPGLAFDRDGHRLGFGAGYYDRFLAAAGVPAVGLAFSLQITGSVPHSARDVPVDWIVTESETIPCRANREAREQGTPSEAES